MINSEEVPKYGDSELPQPKISNILYVRAYHRSAQSILGVFAITLLALD